MKQPKRVPLAPFDLSLGASGPRKFHLPSGALKTRQQDPTFNEVTEGIRLAGTSKDAKGTGNSNKNYLPFGITHQRYPFAFIQEPGAAHTGRQAT